MEKEYCQRTFGKQIVTITKEGSICVAGEWFTNWGLIYPHAIESLKQDVINPVTGFEYQVIGMDSDLSDTIRNWIYSKIKKGYFDHLIEV